METKDVILDLRTQKGLSQEELAEKVFVTRQAVSRWETGETVPNTETLKLLSAFFDVSINTLLGSPRKLVCQCCGMPLEDALVSKEKDGAFNEDYCTWCYARAYMKDMLPRLDYWKNRVGGENEFDALKKRLIGEFNALNIEGMPKVEKLNALVGSYVNLAYPLPSGEAVKFLKDGATYFGNQLESELGGDRCFGILANADFLLVVTYKAEGADPELLLYKKR